jgi:hypothetical protein
VSVTRVSDRWRRGFVPMALRPVNLKQVKRGTEMDAEVSEMMSVRQVFGIESDLDVPAVNVALS